MVSVSYTLSLTFLFFGPVYRSAFDWRIGKCGANAGKVDKMADVTDLLSISYDKMAHY